MFLPERVDTTANMEKRLLKLLRQMELHLSSCDMFEDPEKKMMDEINELKVELAKLTQDDL